MKLADFEGNKVPEWRRSYELHKLRHFTVSRVRTIMGSGRVPPSSLDSLMLAYTDLSAPAKGTGFKVSTYYGLVELVDISSLLGPSCKRH